MNATQTRQDWLEHVTTAKDQKISLAKYARQQQLNIKTLYYWSSVLKKKRDFNESCPTKFVKIECKSKQSAPSQLSAILPNGVKLEINTQHQDLSTLLRGLASL